MKPNRKACVLKKRQPMFDKFSKSLAAGALAIALAISTVPVVSQTAYAESLEELAEKVESTTDAYNDAVAEQERLAAEIESTSAQISELEEKLPGLQDKAGEVIVGLYKQGDSSIQILNAVLGMQSLSDAIRYYEDYKKIMDYNMSLVIEANDAKNALSADKEKLDADKAAQDALVVEAKSALDAAVAARTAAQAEAKAQATGSALASDIDWSLPHDEFVSHWGERINGYLSGTPLSGQGENFADAAYQNGADPRWSPAISRIESSCGAVCFRPYNAWGWMGKSFGSWEDAIYAHVKYLAGPLYGGYLTPKGAATYCPPGGPWYSKVAAEMNKI